MVEKSANSVENIALSQNSQTEADGLLDGIVKRILKAGSSSEYVLGVQWIGKNLPKRAAKRLLGMANKDNKERFANLLSRFADVCPDALPMEPCPDRGIEDVHQVRLKDSTKPISILPYRQAPAQQKVAKKRN